MKIETMKQGDPGTRSLKWKDGSLAAARVAGAYKRTNGWEGRKSTCLDEPARGARRWRTGTGVEIDQLVSSGGPGVVAGLVRVDGLDG